MTAILIYALDQFGQRLLAVGNHTRVEKGTKSVTVSGSGDKRQITGVPVVTLAGEFVGVQAIWQGTTDRCHAPKSAAKHKKLFHSHSATHWSTVETMKRLVWDIIVPDMKRKIEALGLNAVQASRQKAILLLDVWKVHMMHEFKEFLMALNIEPQYLDPSMTSKEQVGDLVVNRKFKSLTSEVISKDVACKVAAQLKARRIMAEVGGVVPPVTVSVKMGYLKPLVCQGFVEAINFFESSDGKSLLLKGVAKSGLDKCHDTEFIRQANEWAMSKAAVLVPEFEPAEVPPNRGDENDFIAYVDIDEELYDLIDMDE